MKLKHFTQSDLVQISTLISAIESKTSGELVCRIVPKTSAFIEGWVTTVGIGYALSSLIYLAAAHSLAPNAPLSWIIVAQLFGALLTSLFAEGIGLRRRLIDRGTLIKRIETAAFADFVRHGIQNTAARTGILVYISEWEHQVVILADKGIHERVGGNQFWQAEADTIARGLRERQAVSGLAQALEEMGAKLQEYFPPGPHNPNELGDGVLTGR